MSRQRRPSIPPVREWRTIPLIVDGQGLQAILDCGQTHLDALLADGLPHLNIGFERRAGGKGTGRTRRSLRFEPQAVITWLRDRNGNGAQP